MDPSRRRRIGVGGAVVAAGSVWETRMQSDDEVSNNAIVLHATNEDKTSTKQMSLKEDTLGVNGKRRTWKSRASDVKSPSSVEIVRANSMKVTRPRSIGTPPMTPRRSISSDDKSPSVSVVKKARSESVEGIEKTTPGRVKKTRSELCTTIVKAGEFDSVVLRKVNSLPSPNSEKSDKKTEHVVDVPKEEIFSENSKIPDEVKEFGVCEEIIASAKSNVDEQIDNGDHEEVEEEEEPEEEEEEDEEEREVEKKSVDVKEMNVAKENRVGGVEINKFSQFHNRTAPSPSSVRKISPPVIKKATSVYSVPLNSTPSTGV